MKQFLLKFSAAFFLLLCCVTASAQDFEANGIYYNRLGGDSCEVTYKHKEGHQGPAEDYHFKKLVIPSEVSDGERTYSVTRIGQWAFWGCNSVKNVVYPGAMTSSGNSGELIFGDSLGYVMVPKSVTSIGWGAFYDCDSLRNVVFPYSVTNCDGAAFQDCDNLINIWFPGLLTSIPRSSFAFCDRLREVYIPQAVTNIGSGAFYDCDSLNSVVFQSSVEIGYEAFAVCPNLKNITIGYFVKSSIDLYNGFKGCDSISKITVLAPEPPYLYSYYFNTSKCKLYVPAAIADKYRNAEGWKEFKIIPELPDSTDIYIPLIKANDGKSYGTTYLPTPAKVLGIGDVPKLYYASAPTDGNVQLHQIKEEWVPSHSGFVVIDNNGTEWAGLKVKYSSTESTLTENALRGCLNDSTIYNAASSVYVLGLSNGVAGFYRPNNNIMKANRAYMPADGQYRTLTFSFDNSVTGIEKIENAEKADDSNNSPIYDLSGRRVYGNLPQGIYVKNGKKFIVK